MFENQPFDTDRIGIQSTIVTLNDYLPNDNKSILNVHFCKVKFTFILIILENLYFIFSLNIFIISLWKWQMWCISLEQATCAIVDTDEL